MESKQLKVDIGQIGLGGGKQAKGDDNVKQGNYRWQQFWAAKPVQGIKRKEAVNDKTGHQQVKNETDNALA